MRSFLKIFPFILVFVFAFILNACSTPKSEKPKDYSEILKDYTKSEATVNFSDENLEKVNIEPTFNVEKHTNSAEGVIIPYYTFSAGACLQRDAVVKIFGTAPKITKHIAISFRNQIYYGTIANGEWEVYLPKMTAGGPFDMQIISNVGRITVPNLYVGEVFLLSGQSNMEFTSYWNSSKVSDLYEDAEACKNEQIRMAKVQQKREIGQPAEPIKYESEVLWEGANKTTIRAFSTVGYIFGKEMQKQLNCPVGLVCNAMGGSLIEYWMSEKTFNQYRVKNRSYIDKSNDVLTNCLGFNGGISPLQGYVFRGVVWYQGESNVNGTQTCYDNALKALMADWREFFDNENLTFTLCELARFKQDPLGYSTINEKINKVAKEDKNVAVAINVDGGDWNDIHPADKHDIGNRAAYETLRLFFGKTVTSAPVVNSFERIDSKTVKLILSENVILKNGKNGFEVKNSLGWSYDVSVSVTGNEITISSDKDFTSVRYGYTVQITNEIREDVSKFVTVFDTEGYPMDLFNIEVA